jgi:uncharacterized membrane protein
LLSDVAFSGLAFSGRRRRSFHSEAFCEEVRMSRLSAFLLGVVAGSRSMLGPAAASQAARTQLLPLKGPLGFLAGPKAHRTLAALAAGELIADTLPFMPSRKAPPSFIWRVVSGGVSGAAVASGSDWVPLGVALGAAGSVVGTVGGAALRNRFPGLATAFVEDMAVAALLLVALKDLNRGRHD